jgi:hypothetical protein
VLLIRRIRDLLYEQGFTISGARNQLADGAHAHPGAHELPPGDLPDETAGDEPGQDAEADGLDERALAALAEEDLATIAQAGLEAAPVTELRVPASASARASSGAARASVAREAADPYANLRDELLAIRALLVS